MCTQQFNGHEVKQLFMKILNFGSQQEKKKIVINTFLYNLFR